MTGIEEIATPRQIALITTRYETKKISGNIEITDNISVITRHIPISSEIYAIAINKNTLANNHIKESKVLWGKLIYLVKDIIFSSITDLFLKST